LRGRDGCDGERRGEDQVEAVSLRHRRILRRSDFASLNERNGVCGFPAGGRILE
jgi:hypothetical protein